ncbi:MAG: hypothetical protein Tsb009_23000 [Planctomycetaceae bacterium]
MMDAPVVFQLELDSSENGIGKKAIAALGYMRRMECFWGGVTIVWIIGAELIGPSEGLPG